MEIPCVFICIFISNMTKMPCFSFCLFSSVKLESRSAEQVLSRWVGLARVGEDKWWGKGVGGRIQCKKCVHVHVNAKMMPVETSPGIGEG
jgi:hypothetical protein